MKLIWNGNEIISSKVLSNLTVYLYRCEMLWRLRGIHTWSQHKLRYIPNVHDGFYYFVMTVRLFIPEIVDWSLKKYRKIPKISPGAYLFQRPFLRGLFLEGLIYGGKFAFQNQLGWPYSWKEIYLFCFVLLCIRGQFSKYKPPGTVWGACIWRGLYMEGLIFGILQHATGWSHCTDNVDKKFIVGYQNEVTFKADLHRIQVSIKHHNRFKSS